MSRKLLPIILVLASCLVAHAAHAVDQCYLVKTTAEVCTTFEDGSKSCDTNTYYDWVCVPTGGGSGEPDDGNNGGGEYIVACYDCAQKRIGLIWYAECCRGVQCDYLQDVEGWTILQRGGMETCQTREIGTYLYDCYGPLCS